MHSYVAYVIGYDWTGVGAVTEHLGAASLMKVTHWPIKPSSSKTHTRDPGATSSFLYDFRKVLKINILIF